MKLFNKPSFKELVTFANTEKAKRCNTESVTCLVQRMYKLPTTSVVADSQVIAMQTAVSEANRLADTIR